MKHLSFLVIQIARGREIAPVVTINFDLVVIGIKGVILLLHRRGTISEDFVVAVVIYSAVNAKSGKPFGKNLRRAMADMGTDVTTTAVLGDQLLTDALAGKLLGLMVLIVPPIADKKTLFFRFKRWLEKPYMNEYKRRHMFP